MTTYKDSGVDVDKASDLVNAIALAAGSTQRDDINVLHSIGGFSSMVELPPGYKQPVIVTCTDGVGTKLKLAERYGKYITIGRDLVAMCINDMYTSDAKPLVFLDYYASNKLNKEKAYQVINGIAIGCQIAKCTLTGGETAELPGTYKSNKAFEIVGFAVGIVEKDHIIDGSLIDVGDYLIGVPSSGLHSNGYSLINKLIKDGELDEDKTEYNWFSEDTSERDFETPLSTALMLPTHIYSFLNPTTDVGDIFGMAHITGGGLTENVPRLLPKGSNLRAEIYWDDIRFPKLFRYIQSAAGMSREEMFKTFNCGIGMVLCCHHMNHMGVLTKLHDLGYTDSRVVGRITA